MPILGLEPFCDAAVATLRSNLPAAIAAVNAEHIDGIVLGTPADRPDDPRDGYWVGGAPIDLKRYPLLELAGPDFDLRNFSLGQVTGDLALAVVVKLLDTDPRRPDLLYRRALRYSTALLRVLMQPSAFGEHVVIDPERGVRGSFRWNPESGAKKQIVGGCLLTFFLQDEESRI